MLTCKLVEVHVLKGKEEVLAHLVHRGVRLEGQSRKEVRRHEGQDLEKLIIDDFLQLLLS